MSAIFFPVDVQIALVQYNGINKKTRSSRVFNSVDIGLLFLHENVHNNIILS